jgi:hypothetical protein
MLVHIYNPSNMGGISRRIKVQTSLGKTVTPYPKNNLSKKKKSGGMVQVVQHLSTKSEALSSSPSTTKR